MGDSLPSVSTAVDISSTDFSLLSPYAEHDLDPYHPSTYSFQVALRPLVSPSTLYSDPNNLLDYSNPVYLFNDACSNDGIQNCTISCLDNSKMFDSLATFHNCAAYPLIAHFSDEDKLNATTSNNVSLESFGFLKAKQGSDLLNNITQSLTKCLSSYCTTADCISFSKLGPANVFNTSDAFFDFYKNGTRYSYQNDPPPGYSGGYPSPFAFADYICGIQSAGLNPDVGGIGVFVSYWIQSGLALLGSFLVLWWSMGVYYVCFLSRSLRSGHNAGREYAKRVGAKYGNRQLPSTIAALTEFQKAQCFFMLAINIAAQVSKHRGDNNPSSLQQLYNNNSLIKAISVSGYLPVTFTLLTLHTVGMVSWYLLVLSVLTVTFSIATSVDIGTFALSTTDVNYLSTQFNIGGTEECGNKNLLVYCLSPPDGYFSEYDGNTQYPYAYNSNVYDSSIAGGNSTMAFCIVVLILLILDQTGLVKKLRTSLAHSPLSKTSRFLVDNFLNIRGLQLLLIAGIWIPALFISFGDVYASLLSVYIFYLYLTSNLRCVPRKTWAGRFFNQWVVLAADIIACVSTFALAIFFISSGHGILDGSLAVNMGVSIGVILWLCLLLSVALTSIHVYKDCKNRSRKHKLPSQYSPSRRRLEGMLTSIQRFLQPLNSYLKSNAARPHLERLKRNMKDMMEMDDPNAKLTSVVICLLYILFHILYIYWFVVYAQYLGNFYGNVDHNSWSFGQVVAITVWAQPLCEYFHLELRGMTRGFQHRLMYPYKVVRQDSLDVETGSPSHSTPGPNPTNGSDQPKYETYEMLPRVSPLPAPLSLPPQSQPVDNDPDHISSTNRKSLSKEPSEATPSSIGGEARSLSDRGGESGYGRARSGSDFSWEERGGEVERGLEHQSASRREYVRAEEPEEEEADESQGREWGGPGSSQEQEREEQVEDEHEPYWRIPESVLLREDGGGRLGFE